MTKSIIFRQKMIDKIKCCILETSRLLWQFKWYIAIYPLIFSFLIHEYFYPPAQDNPIFGSEAMSSAWNYVNQEVYIGSLKNDLIFWLCYFLLGTSNMRNHPLLAKLIFLLPLAWGIFILIIEFIKSFF